MKTLKAICTAAILALALSVPASAGDISSPGIRSTTPGDIQTLGSASTTTGDVETPGLVNFFWTIISML
jgi:hypothetical protein